MRVGRIITGDCPELIQGIRVDGGQVVDTSLTEHCRGMDGRIAGCLHSRGVLGEGRFIVAIEEGMVSFCNPYLRCRGGSVGWDEGRRRCRCGGR